MKPVNPSVNSFPLRRAARAAALAAALALTGSNGAVAQEWLDKAARGLTKQLGLGDTGPDIDYRERSPLVVPPSTTLPPPDTSLSRNDPAWPKDPDVAANTPAKKTEAPIVADAFVNAGRPLTRADLEKGRVPRGSATRTATSPDLDQITGRPLSADKLGYKGGIFSSMFTPQKEEVVPFVREPERTSLIDPPPGYRTPSAAQPYGITGDKKDGTKLRSEKDRGVIQ